MEGVVRVRAVFRDPAQMARELAGCRKVKPGDRDLIAGPGGVVAVLFNCPEAAGADGAGPCAVVPSVILPEPELGFGGALLLDMAVAVQDQPVRVRLAFDWQEHRDFIPRLDKLLGLVLLAGKRPGPTETPPDCQELVSLGRDGLIVTEITPDEELPALISELVDTCTAWDFLAPRFEAN